MSVCGHYLVGLLWRRWIDSVNDYLNIGQARRMLYDMNEWREFINGNGCKHSLGDVPLTLMRSYSCRLSLLYETLRNGGLSMAKPVT